MLRPVAGTLGLAMALTVLVSDARAQMMFPGGFGGFGMSQWGANPSAGYMAGLGAFARGAGGLPARQGQGRRDQCRDDGQVEQSACGPANLPFAKQAAKRGGPARCGSRLGAWSGWT